MYKYSILRNYIKKRLISILKTPLPKGQSYFDKNLIYDII